MSAELIVHSLLDRPSIVALVGDRRALVQLPQGSAIPAIVYKVVDVRPYPNVSYQVGSQRSIARVQFNPLATSIAMVQTIHEVLKKEFNFLHHVKVAEKLLVSCRVALRGPVDIDNETGLWTQPYDYLLQFSE